MSTLMLSTAFQAWDLEPGRTYTVGRAVPGREPEAHWISVAGDPHISREHFQVQVEEDRVRVLRCPSSKNPLLFRGEESEGFTLGLGEAFTTCQTSFSLRDRVGADQLFETLEPLMMVQSDLERTEGAALSACFEAVVRLLPKLRSAPAEPPWKICCEVVVSILRAGGMPPDSVQVISKVGDEVEILQAHGPRVGVSTRFLEEALGEEGSFAWMLEGAEEQTLRWLGCTPVFGSCHAIQASGEQRLADEQLQTVASVLEIVAQALASHVEVSRVSRLEGELLAAKLEQENFGNLLGVFGHHIGTLFKTSGAMSLWSQTPAESPSGRVIGRLLPIWGISQAVSLHKKQGERGWEQILRDWIEPEEFENPDFVQHARTAIMNLAFYIYSGCESEPFLPWFAQQDDGNLQPLSQRNSSQERLTTLPPFRDNELLFDRTLAVTIGLFEMLSNIRAYPSQRGSGREDRRDLAQLPEDERRVVLHCYDSDGTLVLDCLQPLVTASDGSLPRSKSLERIATLEGTLLRGVVETRPIVAKEATSIPYIVLARQQWAFHWRDLKSQFERYCG